MAGSTIIISLHEEADEETTVSITTDYIPVLSIRVPSRPLLVLEAMEACFQHALARYIQQKAKEEEAEQEADTTTDPDNELKRND